MAILYKGYAQQKGFGANLVNVPDPSKKIREQGLVAMSHMKDEIEWNNKQSRRFVQQLESNAQQVAKAHETNFQISQDISQVVANQKWSNFETRIKESERKRASKKQQFQDLLSLTKTGAQLWKQYDAKLKKDADIYALGLYDEHGIGLKKLNAIKDISEEVWYDSVKREAALRAAGLDGVAPDVLDRVRSIGGYRAIAIAKQDARRYAMSKPAYYAEHYETELEVGGVKMSLENAKTSSQVETVLQQLDAQHRREMGDNAPSSKMLALGGGYVIMDQARATILRGKREDLKAESRKNANAPTKLLLNDFMGLSDSGYEDIPGGIMKTIHSLAGHTPDDPASGQELSDARQDVVGTLIYMLDEDELDWGDIQKLENHPIKDFKGGGEPTFGGIYKKDWQKLEDAGSKNVKRAQARVNADLIAHRVEDLKFKSELLTVSQTNPDASTWAKYHSIAIKNNWPDAASFASNQLTRGQSANNDKESIADVRQRLESGEYISDVTNYGASPEANVEMWKLINESNPLLPEAGGNQDLIESAVTDHLQGIIPKALTGNTSTTRIFANKEAVRLARQQYKIFMSKPGATHEGALDHALTYIQNKIHEPGSAWNKWLNKGTGQYEFKGFSLNGSGDPLTPDDDVVGKMIHDNPDSVYNQPILSKDALMRKSTILNKGGYAEVLPRAAFVQASQNKVKALELEQAQIEYYNKIAKENGEPLIPPYPKEYVQNVEKAYDMIHPTQQRLLDTYNYCDVNKAACNSGKSPLYNRPSLIKARTIMSETLGTGEDYNSTDKGNSLDRSDMGFNLSMMTLRQVLAGQADGKVVTVGRYQFDMEALKEAIELTGMPLNNKFTDVNQDLLFDAYFKRNGNKMSSNVKNENGRFILSSVHTSINSDKMDDLGFHAVAYIRPEAFAELERRNRYAA